MNRQALRVAALIGAPLAFLFFTRPKALHFVKVPAEEEGAKVAETKNRVKTQSRGREQSRKLQDMHVDSKGAAWNENHYIGNQPAGAVTQATGKDNTWIKYGGDKATESGDLRSAKAAGDQQKMAPPDYWQDDDVTSHDHTPFPQLPKVQGRDVMPSINEGVVPNKEEKEEAKKESTAKRSMSSEPDVKDNTVMASKAAVKEEDKNRSQHAADRST
jgi:hypothetical protein